MKKTLVITMLLFLGSYCQAQKHMHNNKALNSVSDTVDILNYQINLDMRNAANQMISGNCKVQFTPKVNGVGALDLDLRSLTVDSITYNGNLLVYTYNNILIHITMPTALTTADTAEVIVYYHGRPLQDPSGWGGFYFNTGYTFNLGVAIQDTPHNYGRIWFPCFDNFVEKSTYEFNIITDTNNRAHCNGELMSEVITGNMVERKWVLNEEIPTYLACIAVADYETVHLTFSGMNRSIPVELVALEADTTNVKNSFVHLDSALHAYESSYGEYEWNKIGYSIVPFNAGAMEHATNITYPRYAVNGTLDEERLMAHEFAHSWWGNLVTCETSGDMWINEGMASYSEHLFLEKVYDYATALTAIKDNHKTVVQFVHHREGGFRAISGVSTQYTYSSHVYNKGASVAHNMRAYLGDSLFFVGLKSVIATYKFQNINSYQFRDQLTASTGIDMADFFNDWVFTPGFSHFNIDSVNTIAGGASFLSTIYIQQKLRGTTNYHNSTPLEVSFYDNNLNQQKVTVMASGQYDTASVVLSFNPSFYIINEANRLNQARTDEQDLIKNTFVNKDYPLAFVKDFTVSAIVDSALIQMEHHWVAPDSIKNNVNNYQLSTSRYWSFNGYLPTNFSSSFQLEYDASSVNGFLDLDLFSVFTDTIILMHRVNSSFDWVEYPHYLKTRLAHNRGYMTIDSLILGEFAFANKKRIIPTGIDQVNNTVRFKVYPNPADEFIWVENELNSEGLQLHVFDINGSLVYNKSIKQKTKINTEEWSKGTYLIRISDDNKLYYSEKVIVH